MSHANAAARWCWPLLAAAALSPASAQQPSPAVDPVIANFREYRAALERNDLAGAERAAAAALAASELAQGARTAVLALNLANVRLELGDGYDALTPARLADRLATSSADAGVDPRLTALTVGRAAIAADERDADQRLLTAIAAAETDEALQAAAYDAAVALGQWALDGQQHGTARSAWATAAKLSSTAADPAFARASALIGEGVAIFLQNANPPQQQTGTLITRLSTPDAQAASDAFAVAQALLEPAAYSAIPPGATLTAGQVAFAQALAWQNALFARIQSYDEELPGPPSGANAPAYTSDRCKMRPANRPDIDYPPEALARYGVGAVVAHFALDEDGAVGARTIAAAIPPGSLAGAVQAVLDEIRIEKDPDAAARCRIPSSFYYTVRFVLE